MLKSKLAVLLSILADLRSIIRTIPLTPPNLTHFSISETRPCSRLNVVAHPLSRRSFLQVGVVGGLGLSLGEYFKLQAAQAEGGSGTEPKAKACIHIFLPGGMAHQESFDPKPYAPVEYRGPMGTVKTKLDGVLFNENLKQDR